MQSFKCGPTTHWKFTSSEISELLPPTNAKRNSKSVGLKRTFFGEHKLIIIRTNCFLFCPFYLQFSPISFVLVWKPILMINSSHATNKSIVMSSSDLLISSTMLGVTTKHISQTTLYPLDTIQPKTE